MARKAQLFVMSIATLFASGAAFYVPGVTPVQYKRGEKLEMRAVKMTSARGQLPYDYYSLPFCHPLNDDNEYKQQNLGEILKGDRTVDTPYDLKVLSDESCKLLCPDGKATEPSTSGLQQLSERIEEEYSIQLSVDNLPCATVQNDNNLIPGFMIGYTDVNGKYINNHLTIRIKYHAGELNAEDADAQTGGGMFRDGVLIVGCELVPRSIAFDDITTHSGKCEYNDEHRPQKLEEAHKFYFSYDVKWEPSEVHWSSRWDTYLKMRNANIHWFSILNSLVVILFLSGVLSVIMIRVLRRDIARYNREDIDEEEAFEERGWKLVHGDVFRPPPHSKLFVTFVGTGIMLFCDAFVTLLFALMGMLSPSSRGALITAGVLCYFFVGLIGGYHAGRLYRTIKGFQWKKAAVQTALIFPGIIFAVGFFVNMFEWEEHSSGAIPFGTMMALLFLWFGISLPLVLLGYYFGFRKQPYEHPVRTNQIPRQIPETAWYLNPLAASFIAGALPFGAVFVELYFIMNAIWQHQFYYLFGFLFLVFLILVVCVAIVTIVMTYFQLCAESWTWWWRSFLYGGGVALYVFLYSVFYFFTGLEISGFVPTLVYFTYSFLMAFAIFVMTGTIGFYASYAFVKKIYGAVKTD